jgi:hypothetical protein
LNVRLKREAQGVTRNDISALARVAALAELEHQRAAVLNGDRAAVQPVKKIWSVVTRAVQELDAEIALKYAFITQVARVEMMRELEKKTPSLILSGDGHHQIAVLTGIGAELAKLELKRPRLRGSNGRFVSKKQESPVPTAV